MNGEQDVYYSHIVPPIATGLSENSNDLIISVYPNPGGSFFTIGLAKTYDEVNITVFSYLGQAVKSFQFQHAAQIDLNLSDLNNGIYLLKTTVNNQQTSSKSIIKTSD